MVKKGYYTTALILDGIDFILGVPALLAELSIVALPVVGFLNNIRGFIYDAITIPFIWSKYGGKSAAVGALEIIIPEEVDMLIPTATIAAYMSRRKK